MTVGSILEGAFSLFRKRPGAIAIWGLINLATTIGTAYAIAALVDAQIMSGADTRWPFIRNLLLVYLVVAMIQVVPYTAALRAMLRPGDDAMASLRLGMDEVRQFLVALLYLFLFLVLLFLFSFILALFLSGAGGGAALVFQLLILGGAAWFYTRISLSFPLTLKERQFVIADSWWLTKDRFWTLFGAYAVIFVLMIALSLLVGLAAEENYFSTLFLNSGSEAQQSVLSDVERLVYGGIDVRMVVGWVLSAAVGTIGLTLWAGAAATAAREITGDLDGLAETFS